MKKMKLLCIVLSALLCVGFLPGCSSTKEELLFYVWGDNTELSWYEKVAADFTAESGIQVNVNRATGVYYDNLNINLGNRKNAPDIFFTEQGEFLSMLNAGRLLDLSPYIDSKELDVVSEANPDGEIALWDINDSYRFDGTETGKGNYYALIKDWSPDFMLWYNKNHIDEYNQSNGFSESDAEFMSYPSSEVPMTWDEYLDMSYKLTKRSGNTVSRYGTMLDRVPYKHLMEFIQMSGADTFDADGKYFNSGSDGVKKAFQFFADLQKGDKASAPTIGPSGIGSGESFANGNVSTVWFGSWAYSAYNWNSLGFEYGIAPPPVPAKDQALTSDDCYAVSSGMISLAVNANSPMKDEAVQFLNYYMTKGAEFFAGKGFNLPGNKKVAESDVYLYPDNSELGEINRYFSEFALNYTESIRYNKFISQSMVENVMGKHISMWFNNYNPEQIDKILSDIAVDITNEIG